MGRDELLMIPGPTFMAERTLKAMSKPMISHRGEETGRMLIECIEKLKKVFRTENDVFILTASGTGAMEAAIANVVEPGDRVLCTTCGKFSERFKKIAEVFGAEVLEVASEWGDAVDPERVKEILDEHDDVKAVTVTHNETSTGVRNPVEEISRIVKDYGTLLIVDAISSMGGDHVPVDKWNIDICLAGSQKCFAIPPGFSFISVSDHAWEVINKTRRRTFYFDLPAYRESLRRKPPQTPYTISITLLYALEDALKLMFDEGLDNVIARHHHVAKIAREGVKAMGLRLFPVSEDICSATVTAVRLPDGIREKELRQKVRDYGVVISGGQDKLSGKIFRIGHMGRVTEREILATLQAIQQALLDLGVKVETDAYMQAIEKIR
ncbi:MAG: pyridoxal-phosphate-dependent aminotransferase family protein [Candidatus Freyarchaeota archaeon]|nr:alanine--glyoxylate aminotransferase family protein [Candidatus Freyrarchaeum guaymaensis]